MNNMFRIRSHLFNIRCILQRQKSVRYYASHQNTPQYKVQVRETCPQKPPPPQQKPKDDSAFWGAMAVLFFAGGFVVIAKRSPEMRDWLTIHAPWFDDIIAIAYEENLTYGELAQKCVREVKNYFNTLRQGSEPSPCSLDVNTKPAINSIEPEPPSEKASPVVNYKPVCEIVEHLKDRGEEALCNYDTVITACSLYNQIVSDAMNNFSIPTLKELHGHMTERLNLVREHIKKAEEATADIESVTQYLECRGLEPKEDVECAKQLLSDYLQKIKTAVLQYQWENDKSVALDNQWQKVESLVNKYYKENEMIFPELKYEENNLQFSGDMDLVLYHTNRYSQQLKAQLNDIEKSMTDRVDQAFAGLEKSTGEKEKQQLRAMIQAILKEKRAEMDKEFQKRYTDQKLAIDKRLQDSLKIQLDRHKETLEKKLALKEKETAEKLDMLVAKEVAYEKEMFKKQLEEMAAKLKIVQNKLNARLKAERDQKISQELWIAGASLLEATKKGEPYVKIDKELKAIEKASGDGDKFIDTVLKAIPASVKEKGLVPESVLRERYNKMEATALKVALVEQEGAPLPIYFISWLQSRFLFMKLSGIPQQEIDKPPQEPFQDLDTFDLLQRARFWIERGNFALAIRYVSYLEGASRAAAATWYDAARSHVETRQAAEAILAHAAALGLQYI